MLRRRSTVLTAGTAAWIAVAGLSAAAMGLAAAHQVSSAARAPHAADILVDGSDNTPDDTGCGTPANPCNTIQKGIDVAQPGDTLRIADWLYAEHLSVDSDLTLLGASRAGTVVDAGDNGRAMIVFGGADVAVRDMTFRRGRALDGAGINVNYSSLRLTNVLIHENVAAVDGGGLLVGFGSRAVLSRTIVSAGAADLTVGRGGGVFVAVDGQLTVQDSEIYDSVAGQGGGVASQGRITITRTSILGNRATSAGGGVQSSGQALLEDTRVEDNESAGKGGGLSAAGPTVWRRGSLAGNMADGSGGGLLVASGAYVQVDDAAISGNVGGSGGGLAVESGARVVCRGASVLINHAANGGGVWAQGTAELTNATLSGNTSTAAGGGVATVGGDTTLRNVTVTANLAGSDGGGVSRSSGQLKLANALIADNDDQNPTPDHPDCSGTIQSLGHNLVGDETGCVGLDPGDGDLYGTSLAPIDPLLGPVADNGGQTPTHALLAGSPAVDTGANAGCPATDQRGGARPVDGDGDGTATCDIGAFEFGVTVATSTPTQTPTASLTPTATITPTATSTPSQTPTATATISGTYTATPTRTRYPTIGPSPTPTLGPSPTPSRTPTITASPSSTPEPTEGPSPTPTDVPPPTDTPTATDTALPTDTPEPTVTGEPSSTESAATETATLEPSPVPAWRIFLPSLGA